MTSVNAAVAAILTMRQTMAAIGPPGGLPVTQAAAWTMFGSSTLPHSSMTWAAWQPWMAGQISLLQQIIG